jgi:hypothetical protein
MENNKFLTQHIGKYVLELILFTFMLHDFFIYYFK